MIVHKYEFDDVKIYMVPFIHAACEGPSAISKTVYENPVSYKWEHVTCEECLKTKPKEDK